MGGFPPDLVALQTFAGLALGAVYVLLALGLSLIFGMLGVVNFAHGALFALGAYVGVFLLGLGWNFWAALVAVRAVFSRALRGLRPRTRICCYRWHYDSGRQNPPYGIKSTPR